MNISLIIESFLFSFKLKIITNYRSRCVSIRFLERSIAIRYASYHFQNQSVPTPLCYENHAEKNMFQWKQKAYSIWKLERCHSDPVLVSTMAQASHGISPAAREFFFMLHALFKWKVSSEQTVSRFSPTNTEEVQSLSFQLENYGINTGLCNVYT